MLGTIKAYTTQHCALGQQLMRLGLVVPLFVPGACIPERGTEDECWVGWGSSSQ